MHLGLRNEGESTTTGIDDSCAMVTNCEVKFSISAALKWVGTDIQNHEVLMGRCYVRGLSYF